MRVLVADSFPDSALVELGHLGLDVSYEPGLGRDRLAGALGGVGVLVVRSTEVTAAAIEGAPELDLIVRAGAGVSNIDLRAASARGVYVANCPGKNAVAVAELVFGLIISLDRRIPDAVGALRQGRWEKHEFSKADGLFGKAIGIAGLGAVGREVLVRAKAFGLVPHAFSRSLTPAGAQELGVAYASSIEQLASRVDIMTLHLPLVDRTRGLVGREVLESMRDGALLVNAARAEIVDHEALAELVPKKRLRVALDVVPDEPGGGRAAGYKLPLLDLPNVYATPHIGASTSQAQLAAAAETVRIIRSFLNEGIVPNVVNLCAKSPARYQLVVRHLDKVGVLANVLGVIKRHGINVEELSNTVFDGAIAACAKIRLAAQPSEACLSEIRAFTDEVLHVDLVPLPGPV